MVKIDNYFLYLSDSFLFYLWNRFGIHKVYILRALVLMWIGASYFNFMNSFSKSFFTYVAIFTFLSFIALMAVQFWVEYEYTNLSQETRNRRVLVRRESNYFIRIFFIFPLLLFLPFSLFTGFGLVDLKNAICIAILYIFDSVEPTGDPSKKESTATDQSLQT